MKQLDGPTPDFASGMKPATMLLIEDNPGDVRLAQEALKSSKLFNQLHVVEDGFQAMDFLRQKGGYSVAPRPDLILLDLNLPGKDGREVLDEIKNDADLRRIPVVILTTSNDERDVLASYNLHANCYITKPINLDQFAHIVQGIEDFWFSIVRLSAE